MTVTSTADSKDASGHKVDASTDPQVTRPGSTHSAVKGEVSPRLPHERDESSDSGPRPPDPKAEHATQDAESGKSQTDRGEVTDPLYQQTLRSGAAKPD